MTHVRPEIVRTIGEGIPATLANTLANDPLINLNAIAETQINKSKKVRAESEKFRSTLHSYEQRDVVCGMLRFLRDFFRPLKDLIYGMGKGMTLIFKEKS